MYFKYEVLAKRAIPKEDLHVFLTTWLDRSNSMCMFSTLQQCTWTTSHLTGGVWYLHCAPSFTPFETKFRMSRKDVGESGIELLDLQCIEDQNERAKVMKRRIEEDRKKAQRVKEAEERGDQREREKLQKSLEKSTKKGKKMMDPPEPEGKSLVAPSPTYDSGSHAPTYFRGTKHDSSYERLSQIHILTSREELDIHIQEFILNASMKDILGGDTEELTPSYNELKRFMLKVLLILNFVITSLQWNLCISMWSICIRKPHIKDLHSGYNVLMKHS